MHAAARDTPPAIQAKGQEFAHSVWVLACAQTQREGAQAVKDEARAEVAAVRADLAGATSEIARLENVESAQAAELDAQQSKLRQVELALVEAQAQARRVPELEQSLVQLRAKLDAAHQKRLLTKPWRPGDWRVRRMPCVHTDARVDGDDQSTEMTDSTAWFGQVVYVLLVDSCETEH